MTSLPYDPNSDSLSPLRGSRFNLRIFFFIAAISAFPIYFIGSEIMQSLTNGISNHGSYKEVDLKALGNFAFNPESGTAESIPKVYRDLDGQKVLLRGYMYGPESAGDTAKRFQFVYNVSRCCFSGPPQVQERVFVHATKEIPIYEQLDFAEIVGTLHVKLIKDPTSGKIVSVYDMDIDSARRVQG